MADDVDEEDWMDAVDDDDDDLLEKPIVSRYKVSDEVQCRFLLGDESINMLLLGNFCEKSRKCFCCPNKGDCVDELGSIKNARETIRIFRRKFWNEKSERGHIFERRQKLLQEIESLKVIRTVKGISGTNIQFKIAGIFVCKSFYYVSLRFVLLSIPH